MLDSLYYWIDIIWIPVLFFGVHKKHRWWAAGFAISCIIIVRLLAEVLVHLGYPNGIMGLIEMNVYNRGIIVTSFFYILFLILAHYSRGTEGVVFLAACLTFFFMIFATAAIAMLL